MKIRDSFLINIFDFNILAYEEIKTYYYLFFSSSATTTTTTTTTTTNYKLLTLLLHFSKSSFLLSLS